MDEEFSCCCLIYNSWYALLWCKHFSIKTYTVFHGPPALLDLGFLIVEVSRSHSDKLHSVGLLSRSDRPVAEIST